MSCGASNGMILSYPTNGFISYSLRRSARQNNKRRLCVRSLEGGQSGVPDRLSVDPVNEAVSRFVGQELDVDAGSGLNGALLDGLVLAQRSQHQIASRAQRGRILDLDDRL